MTPWTRYGREGGACIETRVEGDTVWIRDTGRAGEYPLPAASWEALLAAVRAPVEAERDRQHRMLLESQRDVSELVAQLAAAAPVLAAARVIAASGDMPTTLMWVKLAAAVDRLDGVSPEGTARPPGSTHAAPQAPDVAQGTDGLEAHRGTERAHGWTRHGHACCRQPGPSVGTRPVGIARCGGPALCGRCGTEAAQIHGRPSGDPDGE